MKACDSSEMHNTCTDYFGLKRLDFLDIDAGKFFEETWQFDVCYSHRFPFNVLCNFSSSDFIFDGVYIASMEGFIQSLKSPDPEVQRDVCQMDAPAAKEAGRRFERTGVFDGKHLFWLGKRFERLSAEYKVLLERVYEAKYKSDPEYRAVLQATNGYVLTHKVGKTNPMETVLTGDEFIEQLDILRDKFNDKSRKLTISQIIQWVVTTKSPPTDDSDSKWVSCISHSYNEEKRHGDE